MIQKFVLAGGGTGGHIYPAIGIAQAFSGAIRTSISFLSEGRGRLEATLVPQTRFSVFTYRR